MNKKETAVEDRIRGQYQEMPGLVLTNDQAQRLLGIGPGTWERISNKLMAEGFLLRTKNGYTWAQSN